MGSKAALGGPDRMNGGMAVSKPTAAVVGAAATLLCVDPALVRVAAAEEEARAAAVRRCRLTSG